jgi:hypothetical protein
MSNDTMSRFFEGDFVGKAVKVEYGEGKNGKPAIRVMMEILEGPRRGIQVPYDANFKQESIKYTMRDLMALGWKGKTVASLVDDVIGAALIVPFSVRIATYDNQETGKTRQWNSVGSIGNFAPLLAAPTTTTTRNVDSWFSESDESSNGHPNAPGVRGDIPFAPIPRSV